MTQTNIQRMVVPAGTVINGSVTSFSETAIQGRVEGDVTVDGPLHLGPESCVTGNVRATRCRIDGQVDGRVECTEDIELGPSGKLNADTLAGRRMLIAGQILGNVSTPGVLQLEKTAQIDGDIRARRLILEEGAMFNGTCTMRAPAQKDETE